MSYPHIKADPGDEITLTLLNGMTLTGPVDELVVDSDGGVLVLSVFETPGRTDPLYIRGDQIMVWRLGAPVKQVQTRLVPAQLPPGLLGPNGLNG